MKERGARFWVNDDVLTPATVEKDGRTTPVWIQQRWEEGEYAVYIQKNGCGHCSCAMALGLSGVAISPYEEYLLCRERWGEPREEADPPEQHYLSPSGILDIIKSFGVPASLIPVEEGEEKAAADRLFAALEEGKTVIFVSAPKKPSNPFSSGLHYVLAVGLSEDGRAIVANSSLKGKTDPLGIQLVDRETVADALYGTDRHPRNLRWGILGSSDQFGDFILVG